MEESAEKLQTDVSESADFPPVAASGSCPINFAQKRAFDLVLGSIILVLLSPVLLVIALAIWMLDGRPIVFHHVRAGLDGKPFNFLKFRSMRFAETDSSHREYVKRWIQGGEPFAHAADGSPLFKIQSHPRVTRLGYFLRRFSLDELPQIINVLRGEMSLVGPRPAITYEVDIYLPWHRRRLTAPPGVTGLWQVSGRNRLSFDEMVRLDLQYIDNWSLVGDLAILLRTPLAIMQGDGK
jgi:lipopolysaccharide/colanic/teichoic acid biosynthesis glycosyltransferase